MGKYIKTHTLYAGAYCVFSVLNSRLEKGYFRDLYECKTGSQPFCCSCFILLFNQNTLLHFWKRHIRQLTIKVHCILRGSSRGEFSVNCTLVSQPFCCCCLVNLCKAWWNEDSCKIWLNLRKWDKLFTWDNSNLVGSVLTTNIEVCLF